MWRRSPKTLWSPLYSETSDERLRGLFCFGGPWNTLWYVSGARMKATHIVANISCNPFCPFVVRNRVRLLPCCHFCRWRAFAPVAALSNPFLLLVLHRPCGVVRKPRLAGDIWKTHSSSSRPWVFQMVNHVQETREQLRIISFYFPLLSYD